MHKMTALGREMLAFQADLAKQYEYKPIGFNLFLGDIREKYEAALPEWCKLDGAPTKLYTLDNTLIACGYNRIVIGDYGAFVEIEETCAMLNNMRVQPGQEYRINDPRFSGHVKYLWYTAKDSSGIKIYYQLRAVEYADYVPGRFYVSPYELLPGD